jgi:opacity protein-like surface antigen
MRKALMAVLLLLVTSGTSPASEKTGNVSNMYALLGGGTNLRTSGFGEGFYPAAQAGFGYRWGKVEFEADFLFSTIEWKRGNLGYPENPPSYRYVPGQLFGLMAVVKAYPYAFEQCIYPYAIAGVGGQVINIDGYSSGDRGTMIGLAIRAGVGAEMAIVSNMFFNIEVTYSYSNFFDKLDYSTSPDSAGSVNMSGAFKLFF